MAGENDAPQTFKRGPQRAVVIETEVTRRRSAGRRVWRVLGDRHQTVARIKPYGSGAGFRHAVALPRRWRSNGLPAKLVLTRTQKKQGVQAARPDRALTVDEEDWV